MKKNMCTKVLIFICLILAAGLIISAVHKGKLPLGIQGAFYKKINYSCIYLKGSDETSAPKGNVWANYKMDITKKNLGYDGMSGSFRGIDLIRIKSNTAKDGENIVIYLDNVKMLDKNGKAIFTWDFNDSDAHGPYLSQGIKLDDNATIQTLNGEKCFLLHAKSESKYGYNGVEIQWTLPKSPDTKNGQWDLSKNKYTLSFDYYFATE